MLRKTKRVFVHVLSIFVVRPDAASAAPRVVHNVQMYNLQVGEEHSFFVSGMHSLVHNTSSQIDLHVQPRYSLKWVTTGEQFEWQVVNDEGTNVGPIGAHGFRSPDYGGGADLKRAHAGLLKNAKLMSQGIEVVREFIFDPAVGRIIYDHTVPYYAPHSVGPTGVLTEELVTELPHLSPSDAASTMAEFERAVATADRQLIETVGPELGFETRDLELILGGGDTFTHIDDPNEALTAYTIGTIHAGWENAGTLVALPLSRDTKDRTSPIELPSILVRLPIQHLATVVAGTKHTHPGAFWAPPLLHQNGSRNVPKIFLRIKRIPLSSKVVLAAAQPDVFIYPGDSHYIEALKSRFAETSEAMQVMLDPNRRPTPSFWTIGFRHEQLTASREKLEDATRELEALKEGISSATTPENIARATTENFGRAFDAYLLDVLPAIPKNIQNEFILMKPYLAHWVPGLYGRGAYWALNGSERPPSDFVDSGDVETVLREALKSAKTLLKYRLSPSTDPAVANRLIQHLYIANQLIRSAEGRESQEIAPKLRRTLKAIKTLVAQLMPDAASETNAAQALEYRPADGSSVQDWARSLPATLLLVNQMLITHAADATASVRGPTHGRGRVSKWNQVGKWTAVQATAELLVPLLSGSPPDRNWFVGNVNAFDRRRKGIAGLFEAAARFLHIADPNRVGTVDTLFLQADLAHRAALILQEYLGRYQDSLPDVQRAQVVDAIKSLQRTTLLVSESLEVRRDN